MAIVHILTKMKKIITIFCLLFFVLFSSKSLAKDYECHYGPHKDENGINKVDLFPFSSVKINHFFGKITFYPLKPSLSGKHDGIKLETLSFSKKNKSSYKTENFKQRKLTSDEKKIVKNPEEYYWQEVKDNNLEIWFSTDYRNRNPFQLEIVTNMIQNKWVQRYTCYKPRKK